MFREFRRRFWQPPRAHGDVIEDRTVSFLELFYDLVYVVIIAGAAATLAHGITWRSVGEFLAVFGLIWLAWINSTTLYDLHGREDVRTRTYVFIQMLLVALLAVFVRDAAGESGQEFAVVYVLFLALITWLWYSVRRQDSDEFEAVTRSYLQMLSVTTIWMFVSIFVSAEVRVVMWALFVVSWVIAALIIGRTEAGVTEESIMVSDSLVERFGLFTIIVLGEVIVGVVEGLSEGEPGAKTIATGLVGLTIGFGLWWTYFDFVGRRLPRDEGRMFPRWLVGHLPLTAAIAAAGAAMVSLIEHAGDERAPVEASLLIAVSVAVAFLALVVIARTLQDFTPMRAMFMPASYAMMAGAAVALLVGFWRPAPLVLVIALAVLQSVVWGFGVDRWLRLELSLAADAD